MDLKIILVIIEALREDRGLSGPTEGGCQDFTDAGLSAGVLGPIRRHLGSADPKTRCLMRGVDYSSSGRSICCRISKVLRFAHVSSRLGVRTRGIESVELQGFLGPMAPLSTSCVLTQVLF